ncbi:MAG: hypothetical protein K1X52_08775 [Pyrinomonadaceae bacterium]|nr:hypothetical protein [Pyrinomonadaceae bacterium]
MAIFARILVKGEGSGGKRAVLDLTRKGAKTKRLTVASGQNLVLDFGDRLKAVQGTAVVMMNPGTRACAFILTPQLPPNADWKCRTELEIDEESTRMILRGEIYVRQDIGNTTRATSDTTR